MDLENIRDYIARDSERYALAFAEDILDAARSLATLPHRGKIVSELNDISIREIFIKRYRLIYEVSHERVRILAIIHMARDFASLWKVKQ